MFYFPFKQILCFALWFTAIQTKDTTDTMSMEEKIFHSADGPEMFDFFHVMPEGKAMVMTELDLLLTLDQYKALHMPADESSRQKRKAHIDIDTHNWWPEGKVFYEITDSLNDEDRAVIMEAIYYWQNYTCLVFKETSSHENRIQFKDGTGCFSHLGMMGTPQALGLARGCRKKGVIIHEIGHAIGWIHEHMRPDRDKYIHVEFDVIPMRFKPNFVKYNEDIIDTHAIPYDYQSVMHYGSNLLPGSILTLDKDYQEKIGQRHGMSFKDIKLANIMYQCPDRNCPCYKGQRKNCEYGGFRFCKPYKGEKPCQCWCDSGNIQDPLILCSKLDKPPTTPKPQPEPTETPVVELCYDVRKDCKELKALGKCMTMMEVMMDTCSKTCNFCGKGKEMCMDHEKGCYLFVQSGICKNPGFETIMKTLCPASCGFCEKPPTPCDIQLELMGPLNSARKSGGHLVLTFFFMFVTVIRNMLHA